MKNLIFLITILASCKNQKKDATEQTNDNNRQQETSTVSTSDNKNNGAIPSPIEPQKACLAQNMTLTNSEFVTDYTSATPRQIISKTIEQYEEEHLFFNGQPRLLTETKNLIFVKKIDDETQKKYQFHFKNLPPQTQWIDVKWLPYGETPFLVLENKIDFEGNITEYKEDTVFTIPGEPKFMITVIYRTTSPETQSPIMKTIYEMVDLDVMNNQEQIQQ